MTLDEMMHASRALEAQPVPIADRMAWYDGKMWRSDAQGTWTQVMDEEEA